MGVFFKSRYRGMPLKDNFGPTVVSDRRGYDGVRKGERDVDYKYWAHGCL